MTAGAAARALVRAVLCTALAALPSTTSGQTSPPGQDLLRFTISGGVEPQANRTGAFVSFGVSLTPTWSIGFSEINRSNRRQEPNGSRTASIIGTHAFTVGYHPVRWVYAFAGPAMGAASLSTQPTPDAKHVYSRQRVRGTVIGASVRLHDRPFRFYSVTANVSLLGGPHQFRKHDIAFGVGAGFKF